MSALRLPSSYSKYSTDTSLEAYNIQEDSYQNLTKPDGSGVYDILKPFFPISSPDELVSIELEGCSIEEPKFSVEFCKKRLLTYEYSVYGTFKIVKFHLDKDTGVKSFLYIKTQSVFLFNLPVMVNSGSFIVNGIEKVVIPQIHRAPGLFIFDNGGSGPVNYSARIIPYNGTWIEFEIDSKNNVNVRINNRRRINLIYFLFAVGNSIDDVKDIFFSNLACKLTRKNPKHYALLLPGVLERFLNKSLPFSLYDEAGKTLYYAGSKIVPAVLKKLIDKNCFLNIANTSALYLKNRLNIKDKAIQAGEIVDVNLIDKITELDGSDIEIEIAFSNYLISPQTLTYLFSVESDDIRAVGLMELYKILRPGNPFSYDDALDLLNYLFFDPKNYNLLDVGRHRLNSFLGLDTPITQTCLTKEDIIASCKALLSAKSESSTFKDLDSLEHRRIRSVGELVKGVLTSATSKLAKYVSDKFLSATDVELLLPQNVILSNIANSAIRDFFLLSELSHFMDSTNPLSEISHKRRITALGPSGLDRSRARIEVRDVDPSHYGRICPIETPEGANIGLVMSLALFSRLNIYGFLVTPYRVVKNREITDKTEYLDFAKEKTKVIASWTKDLLENNKIAKDTVMARVGGEVVMVKSDTVEYIDFSPRQLISISAGLIPFLETDEAARALMGSNMQRQAFPLIKPTPPLVGTGLEAEFMKYTNSVVKAKRPGVVSLLLPNKIFITGFNKETFEKYVDFYDLKKFDKTNQNTLISQSPIVELGQEVKAGQVISDGQSSDGEELALGRNVLVGFMTWNGYNYEDSIILSEKLVIEEKFDSIHIEEYAIDVKDTRLGAEEVTREIPNISDGSLKLLDESGIVKEGVFVRPGDVLVGKVTPKTQDLLTPEERLLKAIFGERGSEVTDSSLIVKPGTSGTVIGVKIISRRGVEKLSRAMQEEERNILQLSNENSLKIQKITDLYNDVCDIILENQDVIMTKAVKNANQSLATKAFLNSLSLTAKFELKMSDLAVETKLLNLKEEYNALIKKCKEEYENTINNLYVGDDLPQGVLMTIKVYLAIKRIIQPGDKMAGRHGNKGVVSKIVPIEDMPYLKDGTPLDILLSPLGIPQRMNVGQVFETHLGLVGREIGRKIQKMLEQKKMEDDIRTMIKDVLASDRMSEVLDNLSMDELKYAISKWSQDGVRFACPSFDSISSDEIFAILERLGYDKSGQVEVYDGYTGEKVDRKVTIGYVYVLKLHHIVEEKVHARSVGSYSLITQQPLGGRSNFGGQRFGEMECWALQAYGAAYTLQEILTVKSDDVTGRSKMYEAILRGDSNFTYNVPESFNVLVRQLRSLCLNIEVAESNEILNN